MYVWASSREMRELLGQTKRADAVDDSEVDGLGAISLLAGELRRRAFPAPRRRSPGGCPHPGRRHPSAPARRTGGRGCEARPASSRPTAAVRPPRPRTRRGSRGPAAVRIGMFCRLGRIDDSRPVAAVVWLKVVCSRPSSGSTRLGQRLHVGVQELGLLAPGLDHRHDRMQVADLCQHPRVGRIAGLALAIGRQPEPLEQHLTELLRRAQRERPAGQLVGALLELVDLVAELGGDLGQTVDVDLDAGRSPSRPAPRSAAARSGGRGRPSRRSSHPPQQLGVQPQRGRGRARRRAAVSSSAATSISIPSSRARSSIS